MSQPENPSDCLAIIRTITEELSSALDFGEVLRQIVRMTAQAMRVKGCALRLVNERTRQLELSAAWGLTSDYLAKGPIHVDHSLAACMRGQIVHIPDARSDPQIQYPDHAASEGIVSMLSVPMLSRKRVVGVLRLYASERRRFPEGEVEFVRTLAALGALSIEHARLYSRLKEDHDSLIEDFHTWFETSTYKPAGGAGAAVS